MHSCEYNQMNANTVVNMWMKASECNKLMQPGEWKSLECKMSSFPISYSHFKRKIHKEQP